LRAEKKTDVEKQRGCGHAFSLGFEQRDTLTMRNEALKSASL
jgi:hypothetical protein